jgi:hypothetical protein
MGIMPIISSQRLFCRYSIVPPSLLSAEAGTDTKESSVNLRSPEHRALRNASKAARDQVKEIVNLAGLGPATTRSHPRGRGGRSVEETCETKLGMKTSAEHG